MATNAALDEAPAHAGAVPSPSGTCLPSRWRPARPSTERPRSRRGSTSTPRCGTLPEDSAVAVVLRDLCDLDYAEIAEVLDIPPGTVRSRISRGRAQLHDRSSRNATLGRTDAAGTRSPPPHVGTTMADDDARDEDLAAMLEVERLDELERRAARDDGDARRLRAGPSVGVPARRGPARRPVARAAIVAAAAVFVVLAVGAIASVALAGSDDDGRPTAAAPARHEPSDLDGGLTRPRSGGADVRRRAGHRASEGSGAPDTAASDASGGARSVPRQQAGVVYAGDFGDLDSAADRERRLRSRSDRVRRRRRRELGRLVVRAGARRAAVRGRPPDGATASPYADRHPRRAGRASWSSPTCADGSRSIDAVLSDPCEVRRLA